MSRLVADLRSAARSLGRRPLLGAVVVTTLALGIGANTAIFSLLNAVLLEPPPFPEPGRLVVVSTVRDGADMPVSVPDFLDVRRAARSFAGVAAYRQVTYDLGGRSGDGPARTVTGVMATADLFAVLGLAPGLGPGFVPAPAAAGQVVAPASGDPREVVLGRALWRRAFAADPGVVGTTVRLDGEVFTVVGVLERDFRLPWAENVQLWVPLAGWSGSANRGERSNTLMLGRLRPGVGVERAAAELAGVAEELARRHPETNAGASFALTTLRQRLTGDEAPALLLGQGVALFVLLIACVNVANLLLARTAARRPELTIRRALGAGRRHLLRQQLAEGGVLGLAGGAAGILVALWGIEGLRAVLVDDAVLADRLGLHLPVLAFAGLLALAAGLGSGLLPALRTWAEAGAPAERAGTMGRGGARLRRALVASQLALALVLLVGAGLLLRSFERLLAVDLGFESGERVVAPLRLRGVAYDEARARDLRERLAARLAGRPEVSAVAFADPVPLTGASHATTVPIEGYEPPDGRPRAVRYSVVSASYFATLGVGLDAGRGFGGEDRPGSPPVAVVDRTFADRFWPGRQAVGRRLFVWDAWHTVVGVSEPVRYLRPDEQPEPQFYLSLEQHPQRAVQVVVAGGPGAAAALREELAALDPDLPLPVEALADAVGRAFDRHRYLSLAVACFAGVALLLAALGTYGVMASSVAGRTREIGVQMALGARREAVLRGVMREGLALVAVATVAGLAGGWALSRALAGLLYQVSPGDPASYALVTLLLAAVALVACWLPARRAAAVEPLAALRWE